VIPKCGGAAAAQYRACGPDTSHLCGFADKTAGDERARQQLLQCRCNLWKNNTGEYFYDIGSGPSYGAHPCFQSRVIYQEKTLNRYYSLSVASGDKLRPAGDDSVNADLVEILDARAIFPYAAHEVHMDHDTLTEPVSLGYERCQLKGIAFEHKQ